MSQIHLPVKTNKLSRETRNDLIGLGINSNTVKTQHFIALCNLNNVVSFVLTLMKGMLFQNWYTFTSLSLHNFKV